VLGRILAAGLALALLTGCQDDWRTDMWYQPSHRPQTINKPEPEHTVPLGAMPAMVDVDDAEDLKNPVAATPLSIEHGKRLFAERCACCHGKDGHGGGPVSKFFPPAPDIAYKAIKERTDGRLFGTVSLGGRAMPAQGEGLSLEDRWDLVNYVRVIQGVAPAGGAVKP
jgi:mono/diheme cytochrome c family protein